MGIAEEKAKFMAGDGFIYVNASDRTLQLEVNLAEYANQERLFHDKVEAIKEILAERRQVSPGKFVKVKNKATGEESGLCLVIKMDWPAITFRSDLEYHWLANLQTGAVVAYASDKWTFEVKERPHGMPQ